MGSTTSLALLLVAALILHVPTAAQSSVDSTASRLTRIQLTSRNQLEFFGLVNFGSPPQRFRVLLDTGSSDSWVASDTLGAPYPSTWPAFRIQYGSGAVAGVVTREELRLGSDDWQSQSLAVADVCVGLVQQQMGGLQSAGLEGVIGLGMEALAQLESNRSFLSSLVHQQPLKEAVVFSLYLSGWPGELPPSQLILGGIDVALMGTDATWLRFAVVPHHDLTQTCSPIPPEAAQYGFWVLELRGLLFDGHDLPLTPSMKLPQTGRLRAVALLDSGTSFVLLPESAYLAVVQDISRRLGARLTQPTSHSSSLSCSRCQVHEFPSLIFDLWLKSSDGEDATSQRLELQANDYMRCDQRRRECIALLGMTRVAPAIGDDRVVVVLGTAFLRAYYTNFDYTHKQIAISCSLSDGDICTGRRNPLLDAEGSPQNSRIDAGQTRSALTGICIAAAAVAVLFGFRALSEAHFRFSGLLATAIRKCKDAALD